MLHIQTPPGLNDPPSALSLPDSLYKKHTQKTGFPYWRARLFLSDVFYCTFYCTCTLLTQRAASGIYIQSSASLCHSPSYATILPRRRGLSAMTNRAKNRAPAQTGVEGRPPERTAKVSRRSRSISFHFPSSKSALHAKAPAASVQRSSGKAKAKNPPPPCGSGGHFYLGARLCRSKITQ